MSIFTVFHVEAVSAKMINNADLKEACKAEGDAGPNFCYGFIISAANGAQYYRNLTDVSDAFLDICFPADITNKQLVDTFLAWIDTHTEALSLPAFLGVASALSSKYSCEATGEDSSANAEKSNSHNSSITR